MTTLKCNKYLFSVNSQDSEVSECTPQGLQYCLTFLIRNDDGEIIHEELGCLPGEVIDLDLYCGGRDDITNNGRSVTCCDDRDYCNTKVVCQLPLPLLQPHHLHLVSHHTHTHMHTHTHTHVHTLTHTRMHTHTHVHTCTHSHTHTCTHTHTRAHTHTHTCTNSHTHARTHTRTLSPTYLYPTSCHRYLQLQVVRLPDSRSHCGWSHCCVCGSNEHCNGSVLLSVEAALLQTLSSSRQQCHN